MAATEPTKAQEPGARCPKCKSVESYALETRGIRCLNRRRRECKTCGERFTTYEGTLADLRRLLR